MTIPTQNVPTAPLDPPRGRAVRSRAWRLHRVLVHGEDVAPIPLLCRTHLHHHWVHNLNEEGTHFITCALCGRDKDGLTGAGANFTAVGAVAPTTDAARAALPAGGTDETEMGFGV